MKGSQQSKTVTGFTSLAGTPPWELPSTASTDCNVVEVTNSTKEKPRHGPSL